MMLDIVHIIRGIWGDPKSAVVISDGLMEARYGQHAFVASSSWSQDDAPLNTPLFVKSRQSGMEVQHRVHEEKVERTHAMLRSLCC
jgi:hypothetical protein